MMEAQRTHRRSALRLAIVLGSLAGCVQPTERPLLWRIEAVPPSYLYGTIHVPDARVLALPPVVTKALAASDEFYGEVPWEALRDRAVGQRMKLPAGQHLADVVPDEVYRRADRYLRAKGLSLRAFSEYQIWTVTTMLVLVDYLPELLLRPPLDQKLYDLARWHGLPAAGLETLNEQLVIFESLSREQQVEWLAATLDLLEEAQRTGRSPSRQLVETYLGGDEGELHAQMLADYDPNNELMHVLFERTVTKRNVRFADRIDEALRANAGRSSFFAIGAGHLVGADGVVARLRERGWLLLRMTPTDADALGRRRASDPAPRER